MNVLHGTFGPGRAGETRGNAVVCGLLFVIGGVLLVRAGRKPHFEDVFVNFGLLLLFGGLLSGVFGDRYLWGWWLLVLAVVSAAIIAIAFQSARMLPFAEGVVAAYLGSLRLLFEAIGKIHLGSAFFLVVTATAAGVLGLLVAAHRKMRER